MIWRYAIGSAVAVALVGCRGTSGTMPQTSAIAMHVASGKSWMSPEAQGRDLLYISSSTYQYSIVYVYTFPGVKLVGGIVAGSYASGLCSNANGDVFVTDYYNVYEYRHGQARRVATIGDPLGAYSCSVNPTNGDLAVAGFGGLAVFHHEKRNQWHVARLYGLNLNGLPSCVYDGSGNLFLDGPLSSSSGSQQLFAELPSGEKQLENLTLNVKLPKPGNLAWDGRYLVVGDRGNVLLHRFAIRGRKGTQVGKLSLDGAQEVRQFWIQNGILIAPAFESNWLFGLWHYPDGGAAESVTEQDEAWGAAVSVAHRKREREE